MCRSSGDGKHDDEYCRQYVGIKQCGDSSWTKSHGRSLETLNKQPGIATNAMCIFLTINTSAIMRPLSGSGSLGIVTELFKVYGADSFIGRLAASAYGSTETTFYVLAVYFGAVGIKKRHVMRLFPVLLQI
jgi:spore maturation protein SpmB